MKPCLPLSALSLAMLVGLSACTQANDLPISVQIASANGNACELSAERHLALDLAGVETIRFASGQHTLRIDTATDGDGRLTGRGCASSQELLDGLGIKQSRDGSTLVVELQHANAVNIQLSNGKGRYAWMDLAVTLPAGIPVELQIGSGDVSARNLPALTANVASGDLHAEAITGPVRLNVASGDANLVQIGSLDANVASGDLKASRIGDSVKLNLASGDVLLDQVQGEVHIGNVSSGDLEARAIAGNVHIGTLGSGDIDLKDISGTVTVQTIGSGDLDVDGASGLEVSSIGSGDVTHRKVSGAISLPHRR